MVTYKIPDYPFPYFRGKNGGIYRSMPDDEDDGIKIYDYDFLGNDWGFYIDIEKPYSNYDFEDVEKVFDRKKIAALLILVRLAL